MRTTQNRYEKYDQKVDPATVGLKFAAQLENAKNYFAAATNPLVLKEQETAGVLDREGVSIIDYPFYLNFSREIWSMIYAGHSGPTLLNEARILATKYVRRGLDPGVLGIIAEAVFSLQLAPAPPLLLLPEPEATEVPVDGDLTWSAAAGATGYDVWLGLTAGPIELLSSNQPGLSFSYSGLEEEAEYRWYIGARNAIGVALSALRTFTTEKT